MLKTYRIPILTLLSVLTIDQVIKIFVKLNYRISEQTVFTDWCKIYFTENPGMAFGMEFGGDYGKLILSVFRIIASIGGIWYIRHMVRQKESALFVFCVSLILAGAIGNILDSLFYGIIFTESDEYTVAQLVAPGHGYSSFLHGHVVDMFYFPMVDGHFPDWFPFWGGEEFQFFRPIFNFADFSISVGVALLIIFQKRITKKQVETNTEAEKVVEEPKTAEN